MNLSFAVHSVTPDVHAAAPTLTLRLRIADDSARPIHAIMLRYQLRIEPRLRRHGDLEHERLFDVFGEPERWNDTMRPLIWLSGSVAVPAFNGSIEIDLPCACTYDFEVVAAKYLQSLEGGDVPLRLLFSGTVFVKTDSGFQVAPIPWDKEAAFRMPVSVWRELMDAYFPGSAWIRLRRENLDRLLRFKARRGLVSWDQAIEALVGEAREASA